MGMSTGMGLLVSEFGRCSVWLDVCFIGLVARIVTQLYDVPKTGTSILRSANHSTFFLFINNAPKS